MNKKPLPVNISDFKTAVKDFYYVDKTLMIHDFLDKRPAVTLFTRPDGFGKTMIMNMFRTFFEKSDEDNSVYFKDKDIWNCGSYYTKHQGIYPTIFLSLKDVKCQNWEEEYERIKELICLEFKRHRELETSEALSSYERERYRRFLENDADEVECQMALQFLTRLLHKHHKQGCIVIIDDYDMPAKQGYLNNYYSEAINFLSSFYSAGMKDNSHMAYGFLTGTMYVSMETITGGFNNLRVKSLFDNYYEEYFGFTETEIKNMLAYYDIGDRYKELHDWYGGYLFGINEVFNPESVCSFLENNLYFKPYWKIDTNDRIIRESIFRESSEVKEEIKGLIEGREILSYIDTNISYPKIKDHIYSFLLSSGYLRISRMHSDYYGGYMCELEIANKEMSDVLKMILS